MSSRWLRQSRRRCCCHWRFGRRCRWMRCSRLSPTKWGRLDILVHSIAFAPREALAGRVTDCPRDGFLTAMEVSCWSLLDLTRRAEPLMTSGRHDLRHELSRRQQGHRELRDHGTGQGRTRIGSALSCSRTRPQGHPRARDQPRPAGDPRRFRHPRFRCADGAGGASVRRRAVW